MADERQAQQMALIASLYYDEGLTQVQIAKRMDLSRVKVYRLLKEARESGVVEIFINWPIERDAALEAALVATFGLGGALVLSAAPVDPRPTLVRLGQLGARYLESILRDGTTLTVCIGRSTYQVINAIRPGFRANVRVAQAMGSIPFAAREFDSAGLARQLAQKLGGEVLYLSSPLMADSPEAAEVLRAQQGIKRTLDAARSADVALVGIGNLDPAHSGQVQAGFISIEEIDRLKADGVVGDTAGRLYTLDGQPFPCSYSQRSIGITIDELRRIPVTLAVAAGLEKTEAILGGLRTGGLSVLCTDDATARAVLKLNQERPAARLSSEQRRDECLE